MSGVEEQAPRSSIAVFPTLFHRLPVTGGSEQFRVGVIPATTPASMGCFTICDDSKIIPEPGLLHWLVLHCLFHLPDQAVGKLLLATVR